MLHARSLLSALQSSFSSPLSFLPSSLSLFPASAPFSQLPISTRTVHNELLGPHLLHQVGNRLFRQHRVAQVNDEFKDARVRGIFPGRQLLQMEVAVAASRFRGVV